MSLTETEEECVHAHAKNAEEATGNDIGPQDGGLEDIGLLGFLWGVWRVETDSGSHSP